MQPLTNKTKTTGSLLFVISAVELPHALRHANALLSHRRSCGSPIDRILGILLGHSLDARIDASKLTMRGVIVHESIALSGIWSLVSFELGSSLAEDAAASRTAILDGLRPEPEPPGQPFARPVFVPVLTSSEVLAGESALFGSLETRYPTLSIERRAFLQEPARGGLVAHA